MAKKNNEVSGWAGWIGFASFMMILIGSLHIIAGLAAIFKDDVYVATQSSIWLLDYTQWGWVHLIGGILALCAAASLVQGRLFGRTLAVLVALVSAVVNIAFIPVYPIWSIMIVTIDVLVIWAVTVHGGELRES